MGKKYIGIDIGGTNIRIGYGVDGIKLQGYEKVPREQVFKSSFFSADLAEYIKNYMRRHGLDVVEAIGIGLPSILSVDRRVVLQTPNISGMNNIPMAAELEEALRIPIYLEKDTNILFMHDSNGMKYAGVGVGIYFGTGIGNALFFGGVPHAGYNGVAGEIGHIPIRGSQKICGCGNVGCAETVASGNYLSRLQKELYPETSIGELFEKHGQEEPLRKFLEDIAMVIATEVNILDPEILIVGGGIPDMQNFPKERLVELVHFHSRKPYPAQNLNIIFAKETQQSGVLGAISYASTKAIGK